MTETQNPMSPSLAGIVSDPNDSSRRIVPSSQRADGSVRRERKVRPGHVPAEDVAKYKPGQGSLRAQHQAAQAAHQAPASPSPAPASTIRRPNPADFLMESKLREQQQQQQSTSTSAAAPPPSPTKASTKSGASSSRWATAAPAPEPAPTPAPAPAPVTWTAARGKPRTRGGPRKGKGPSHTADAESQEVPVSEVEEAKENVEPPKAEAEAPKEEEEEAAPPTRVPSTPKSTIPDLPETPGGDWWEDDDDDEVDAAAQALQGISIKDTAARQPPRQASPTPTPPSNTNRQLPVSGNQSVPPKNNTSNHNNGSRETHSRAAKKATQQPNSKAAAAHKGGAPDLLSRLGPAPPTPSETEKTPARVRSTGTIDRMTLQEIRDRARDINTEARTLNQLKRYAEAGAVLSNEQRTQVNGSAALLRELGELKAAAEGLVAELGQLLEASHP